MRENWEKGLFNFLYKREKRKCARKECDKIFEVKKSDPKIYCSNSCAAQVNNKKRKPPSLEARLKASEALKGTKSPFKGILKVPRIQVKCLNPVCGKVFLAETSRVRKFCSNQCAMDVIGGKATSPKAARGKAGIRKDISKTIYFYSRWEANVARLFNYLKIEWLHQPRVFNLNGQNYTPDFYLLDHDIYIEV